MSRVPKFHGPDYALFGYAVGEVGAAWNMTGEVPDKKYKPAPFEHLNIFVRKAYANLDRRKGVNDKIMF